MTGRIRRLFPQTSRGYELFDSAVLLFVLGFVGYVLTDPPPMTEKALTAPYRLAGQPFWGILIASIALLAIVCSYVPRWVNFGYFAVIYVCAAWSGIFLGGIIIFGASPRVVLSVFIYGWVASGLARRRELA